MWYVEENEIKNTTKKPPFQLSMNAKTTQRPAPMPSRPALTQTTTQPGIGYAHALLLRLKPRSQHLSRFVVCICALCLFFILFFCTAYPGDCATQIYTCQQEGQTCVDSDGMADGVYSCACVSPQTGPPQRAGTATCGMFSLPYVDSSPRRAQSWMSARSSARRAPSPLTVQVQARGTCAPTQGRSATTWTTAP